MKRKQEDDEFVLTISDDEGDGVPDLDAEVLAAGGGEDGLIGDKKRKRGLDVNGAEEVSGESKRSKNSKTKMGAKDGDHEDSEGEEQTIWGAKDEDDGAM